MINPKPEHRITFLEKQFLAMGGHLEGIQEDIEKLNDGMMSSFKEIGTYFELTEKAIDKRFEEIKTTMATKEELTAMENRINNNITVMKDSLLDAIKQLQQQKPSGDQE